MQGHTVRVWDEPLRLFHWTLVASFTAAWLWQGDRWLHLHLLAGWIFLALLLFRMVWGFTGTRYARFSAFACGWREAWLWLREVTQGGGPRRLGHNPAGAWAIFAIFFLGLLLAVTGIVTQGGEERHGPLAGLFGFATGASSHLLHEALAWGLLALLLLHVAGVVVESLQHRENLALAVITGRKRAVPAGLALDVPRRRGVAMLLAVALLLFILFWLRGSLAGGDDPFLPFVGPELPHDAAWQEECGGCHLAYHPSLLPAASWQRLLREQEHHFGEDLALDPDTVRRLQRYAVGHAAETTPTEASWKILHSIPAGTSPLRITETPYWRRKHREIEEAVFRSRQVNGRFNCDACHLDADAGSFEDGAMRLPRAAGLDDERSGERA